MPLNEGVNARAGELNELLEQYTRAESDYQTLAGLQQRIASKCFGQSNAAIANIAKDRRLQSDQLFQRILSHLQSMS